MITQAPKMRLFFLQALGDRWYASDPRSDRSGIVISERLSTTLSTCSFISFFIASLPSSSSRPPLISNVFRPSSPRPSHTLSLSSLCYSWTKIHSRSRYLNYTGLASTTTACCLPIPLSYSSQDSLPTTRNLHTLRIALSPSSHRTSTFLGLKLPPTRSYASFGCVIGQSRDSGQAGIQECRALCEFMHCLEHRWR